MINFIQYNLNIWCIKLQITKMTCCKIWCSKLLMAYYWFIVYSLWCGYWPSKVIFLSMKTNVQSSLSFVLNKHIITKYIRCLLKRIKCLGQVMFPVYLGLSKIKSYIVTIKTHIHNLWPNKTNPRSERLFMWTPLTFNQHENVYTSMLWT